MTTVTSRFLCVSLLVVALASVHDAWADPPHTGLCSVCHSSHNASYPELVSQLCEGCHFAGGPAPAVETHSSLTTDNGYGNWHVDCWGCHDPHTQNQDRVWGTTYGMYLEVDLDAEIIEVDPSDQGPFFTPLSILRTVTSSNVEHTSPNTFVDGDAESSDDICQVCHESTAYYEPTLSFNYHADYGADTQPGGDCVQCHFHESGFSPAGGSCTSCHAQAQGSTLYRRQVAGAGGDFERASHHVTDGSTTEIVTDDDCIVCHDQGLHQSNGEPAVTLNDPDGGSSHTYDGAGASIESFCINCHDADGSLAFDTDLDNSDGYQPFSDNRTPQDIATGWAGASHNTSSVATFVDEACMACHGGTDGTRTGLNVDPNAHGSDNESLLSDLINGVTVANVEEDLCHACHDLDGPAATDIEAEFAKGSSGASTFRHPVDDFEQSIGRKVECTDCHNPHYATSATPWDGAGGVDLAGNPVDVGLPVAEYEVCLKCHGDTYNAGRDINGNGIVDTTNKRLDFATNASAFHAVGNPGRNQSGALQEQLLGGLTTGSTLECSDCHNSEQTADALGAASNSAAAVKGPHGSTIAPILRANFDLRANGPSGPPLGNFEICFLCHDQQKLVSNESFGTGARTNFYGASYQNLHYGHLVQWDTGATCRTCHFNSHGNQSASNTIYRIIDGGTTDYQSPPVGYKTRMVNFSPYVQPNNHGKPMWQLDPSTRWRSCDVRCHGTDHQLNDGDFTYNPQAEHGQSGQDDDPLTY